MARPPTKALFVARASYRQRRLRDAVRMLPVAGALLWMLPLLWTADPEAGATTSGAVIYVFGIWIGLICLTALVSARVRPDAETPEEEGGGT